MTNLTIKNGAPVLPHIISTLPNHFFNPGDKVRRHPIGLFNTSIAKMFQMQAVVLNELSILNQQSISANALPSLKNILNVYEHFMYAQFEFIEDCRTIAHIVFDPSIYKSGEKSSKKFKEKIDIYRQHIAALVNCIKHDQGRMRPVWIHTETVFVPGYFVETAYADGSVGPHPFLHNDGDTAISLAWDIRYHFVQAFKVISELEKFISRMAPDGFTPEEVKPYDIAISNASLIEKFTNYCFPNELWMPAHTVKVIDEDILLTVGEKFFRCPLNFQVVVEFMGDGATNSFKLPYKSANWDKLVKKKLRIKQSGYERKI